MLPTEFDEKQKKAAEFISYITDSIAYFDDTKQKYVVVPKQKINAIINELYEKKNFYQAGIVLETAKKLHEKDYSKSLAEIVSKSIRVGGKEYLKLVSESFKQNVPVSDVLKKLIIGQLKQKITELKSSNVNSQKLELIDRMLEKTEKSSPVKSPQSLYDKGFHWYNSRAVDDAFQALLKHNLIKKCEKSGFSNEKIKICLSHIVWKNEPEYEKEWDQSEAEAISLNLMPSDKKVYDLKILLQRNLDFVVDDPDTLREEIGSNYYKFVEISGLDEQFSEGGSCPANGSYFEYEDYINIDDNLTDEQLKDRIKKNLLLKYNIENIDSNSIKLGVEKAIKQKNFAKAKLLNEKLTLLASIEIIAKWIVDILKSSSDFSEVITFTIPKGLLELLTAFQDDVMKKIGG